MEAKRAWIRGLFGVTLVAACLAAALAPILPGVLAAPNRVVTSQAPGDLVISQFTFAGPNGEDDEFVEIFNRSCTNTIPLANYELRKSAGSTYTPLYDFPATTLAPGHYYLIGGPSYSLGLTPTTTVDGSYITGTPGVNSTTGGVALFSSTDPANVTPVDAAGIAPTIDDYAEGTGLGVLPAYNPGPPLVQPSYQRKTSSNFYVDTNNNSQDFQPFSVSAPHNNSDNSGTCGTPVPTATSTPSKTGTPSAPGSGSVIINEIGWAGTPRSSGDQWIELFNNTSSALSLNNWNIYNGNGLLIVRLTGTIPAHGYYLLVKGTSTVATTTPTPGACTVFSDVTYDQFFTTSISTFGDKLFLYDQNGAEIDSANSSPDIKWRAGSFTNRASMERRGPVPDNPDAWITYANPGGNPTVHDCSGNRVYGTPKQQNWAFGLIQTPSPVPTKTKKPTGIPPTPFAHMVIDEFLPRAGYDWNQDGTIDVYDEFIELKNLGPINVSLSGWKLSVISPGGSTTYSLPAVTMTPNQRVLYYGLTTKITLYDSGGTIRLINNRGVIVDARGYGPVQAPDESHCRLPDGFYWRFPCFPTPGNINSLTGLHPAAPPSVAVLPPPCLLADTVPAPFRQAECNGFGAEVFNPAYWDDPAGMKEFPVRDVLNKNLAVVQ